MAKRAHKRHRELCQIWIQFAERLREDGIPLGMYAGIDKFEAYLWMRCKDAENEANKAERALTRETRKQAG